MPAVTVQTPTPASSTDAPPRPSSAAESPALQLTDEQRRTLAAARHTLKKVRRAANVAAVSGWTLASFAGLTLLTGLFSIVSLLLGLALAALAWNEIRAARRLRNADLTAPRILCINQIILAVVIVVYASWGIIHALSAPGPYDDQLAAGGPVAEMLEPIDRLQRTVTFLFYSLVIVGALIAQSAMATYYFTRTSLLRRHRQSCPPWVLETLRTLDA